MKNLICILFVLLSFNSCKDHQPDYNELIQGFWVFNSTNGSPELKTGDVVWFIDNKACTDPRNSPHNPIYCYSYLLSNNGTILSHPDIKTPTGEDLYYVIEWITSDSIIVTNGWFDQLSGLYTRH